MKNTLTQLALGCALAATASAEITIEKNEDSLSIMRNGELVTSYRTDQHVPALYPLVGPNGTNITRHYPFTEGNDGEEKDHPHHVSFWYTHGLVNGLDFWTTKHDPDCRIKHLGFGETSTGSLSIGGKSTDTASFSVKLAWNHKDQTLLTETRTYTLSANDDSLAIDVRSEITAPSEKVVFGDTKEGSFAIRFTPSLRLKGKVAKGHIFNSEGQKDGEVWGKRASWVAYQGPDAGGKDLTVAIFDHPENLRYPTWWHARDYGLLAANPFGEHDFESHKNKHIGDHTLEKGDTFTQTYRLHVAKGLQKADEVATSFQAFSGQAFKK
ncbi:MAG: PmoA family protein [Verrucomicrobiales bacterium]